MADDNKGISCNTLTTSITWAEYIQCPNDNAIRTLKLKRGYFSAFVFIKAYNYKDCSAFLEKKDGVIPYYHEVYGSCDFIGKYFVETNDKDNVEKT